jgi:hypothetical protein
MLRDQTIAEVSASGGAYRDYLRFTRPTTARQMRALGLEFEFSAAKRDGLRLAQPAVDDFGRHHRCTFAGDDPSAEIEFAATDLLASIEPMIAAAGQRLGTGMDDPAGQSEPALIAGTGPWLPATR